MWEPGQDGSARVRDAWARDEPVYAAWSVFADPLVAEVVASSGVDAVVVDLQHGNAGWDALPPLVRAIRHGGAAAMVRLQWHRPELVMRALDAGADTVIVPMIESATQAEAAARASRYPPEGERSWGRLVLPTDADGALPAHEVNTRVRCLVMIETRAGVDALDDILAVDGVDGVFVGPHDLALTFGYPGRTYRDSTEVDGLIGGVVDRCVAAGRLAGVYCSDAAMAADWASRGARLLSVGMDRQLVAAAYHDAMAQVRPPSRPR